MSSLMNNGCKATTMDSVASAIQMSKRTLYEIFGSKEELFKEVHKFFHSKMRNSLKGIFENSSNVMEAIIKCFLFHRDTMSVVNTEFIREMEQIASHNGVLEEDRQHYYQNFYDVLLQGVEQGYFRDDINLKVQCRMLIIQMNSLKRTEELFPEDITLLEVYDSIIISFLRGISTLKGLKELEPYLYYLAHNTEKVENKI